MPEFETDFKLDYAKFYRSPYIGGVSNESKENIKRMVVEFR